MLGILGGVSGSAFRFWTRFAGLFVMRQRMPHSHAGLPSGSGIVGLDRV